MAVIRDYWKDAGRGFDYPQIHKERHLLIKLVRVIDLTDEQIARCRELSYGDEGYMCEDLERILEHESHWKHYRYSYAMLFYVRDLIVGWCLMQPKPRSKKWTAQFFVDPDWRRRGIGTELLRLSNLKFCKAPLVYTDDDNEAFFECHPELSKRDWEYA